jgi:hypothetical protein
MQDQAEIQKKAAALAKTYGDRKCLDFAKALKSWLSAQKIKGKFLTMQNAGPSRGFICLADDPNNSISDTGKHYGIEVDGIVYGNFHPKGIARRNWEVEYVCDGDLKIQASAF